MLVIYIGDLQKGVQETGDWLNLVTWRLSFGRETFTLLPFWMECFVNISSPKEMKNKK